VQVADRSAEMASQVGSPGRRGRKKGGPGARLAETLLDGATVGFILPGGNDRLDAVYRLLKNKSVECGRLTDEKSSRG
jgi:hypothetical protein